LYDYGAFTTLFYDFTPILIGHDPATLVLSMLNKSSESVELPDHEDYAAIILRFKPVTTRRTCFYGWFAGIFVFLVTIVLDMQGRRMIFMDRTVPVSTYGGC
jgi:hypothetical protein